MDRELKIKLDNADKVKKFSNIIAKLDGDIDLMRGHYTVDARSIMGIFSLDLSKELTMVIHSGNTKKIEEAISEFLV